MTDFLGFLTCSPVSEVIPRGSDTGKSFDYSFNDSFDSSLIMVVHCNLKTEMSFFRIKFILRKLVLFNRTLRECLYPVEFSMVSLSQFLQPQSRLLIKPS